MKALELKIPPVALLLIFAFLMWALNSRIVIIKISFAGFHWLGPLCFVLGTIVALLGVYQFRKFNTTVDPRVPQESSSLVTAGIYQYSRNPMYLGFLLMLTAWAIALANPLAFIGLPLFVMYMNRFQIKPEERFMQENFGDEYRQYQLKVRRWI